MNNIPLSILAALFGLITRIRNYCYDKGWIKSFSFPKKNIVVIGNLAVGGTGKSPLVNYLLQHWPLGNPPVILSRGYGRKTKGFRWAESQETVERIGDEPLTYRLNFPSAQIALGENRVHAINQILNDFPDTDSILLDDAFQHRALKASLNIVCTTFQKPFYVDELMPKGRLRESIDGINRAQAVIVNRCPDDVSDLALNDIRFTIQQLAQKEISVFFTGIKYGSPVGQSANSKQWFALAGIAQPDLFFQQIADHNDLIACETFPDHYIFSSTDFKHFEDKAAHLSAEQGIITTFKDYVRLIPHLEKYPQLKAKLCYLPMEIYFIGNETEFMNWFKAQLQKSK